jgi:hypothetical protein
MINQQKGGSDNNINPIYTQIDNLLSDTNLYTFTIFNIDYTQEEKKAIDSINISRCSAYDHFGYSNKIDKNILSNFLLSISDDNTKYNTLIIANFISNLAEMITYAHKKDSCWITIRASIPNSAFKIPRYHQDGSFFNNKNDTIQTKFIMTLKGPGTLLINASKTELEDFNKILLKYRYRQKHYDNKEIEKYLDIELLEREESSKIFSKKPIQLTNNQGAVFITFYKKNSIDDITMRAIHSEPDINEQRLFISILPGTHDEINELKTRWKR